MVLVVSMSDIDKKSPFYLKSSFESGYHESENSVVYERELKIEGPNATYVKNEAPWIKSHTMP